MQLVYELFTFGMQMIYYRGVSLKGHSLMPGDVYLFREAGWHNDAVGLPAIHGVVAEFIGNTSGLL